MNKKDLRLKAKDFRINADVEQASFKIVERIKNLVEYKNAKIVGASNPGAFNPAEDNRLTSIARKYFD